MKRKMTINETNTVNTTLSWLGSNNVESCDSFEELIAKIGGMDELRTRVPFWSSE